MSSSFEAHRATTSFDGQTSPATSPRLFSMASPATSPVARTRSSSSLAIAAPSLHIAQSPRMRSMTSLPPFVAQTAPLAARSSPSPPLSPRAPSPPSPPPAPSSTATTEPSPPSPRPHSPTPISSPVSLQSSPSVSFSSPASPSSPVPATPRTQETTTAREAELASRNSLIEGLMLRMEEYEEEQEKLLAANDKLKNENQSLKVQNHRLEQAIFELQTIAVELRSEGHRTMSISAAEDGIIDETRIDTTDGLEKKESAGNAGETCDPEETRKAEEEPLMKKRDSQKAQPPQDKKENAVSKRRGFSIGGAVYWMAGCFVVAVVHAVMYLYCKVSLGGSGNKSDRLYLPETQQDAQSKKSSAV